MEFSALDLTFDVCIMSALLVLGKIIRTRVPLLQNLFIPSALIAGFIGIILGPFCLNWVPLSSQASRLCRHPHCRAVRHPLPGSAQPGQLQGDVPPSGRHLHAERRRRGSSVWHRACPRRNPRHNGIPRCHRMVSHPHARRLRRRARHSGRHWLGVRGRRLGRGYHGGSDLRHLRPPRRYHQRYHRYQLLRQ